MRRFEQRMSFDAEVEFCYATGGGMDSIAMIQASDTDQYQRFIDQLLLEDLGIERYFTCIVTKSIKTGGALPAQMHRQDLLIAHIDKGGAGSHSF